jgi:hypothetical protein
MTLNEGGINCLDIYDLPEPAGPAKNIALGADVASVNN